MDFLNAKEVEYKRNVSLSSYSFVRIGGDASIVCFPNSETKLVQLLRFLKDIKIEYKMLGRMSNVLPSDNYYDGVIIKTDRLKGYRLVGDDMVASCGLPIPLAALIAQSNGLYGLAQLGGIPGSIGAGVKGNAGAFGREFSQIVKSVRAYDIDSDEIVEIGANDCGFGYRSSSLADSIVILSANLSFRRMDINLIKHTADECRKKRIQTQPIGLPSLGSVFKRPSADVSAARLIDECGLKGRRIGDAMISDKHCGFIVNCDKATAKDYLSLCDVASEAVYCRFGVRLIKEIEVM